MTENEKERLNGKLRAMCYGLREDKDYAIISTIIQMHAEVLL